MQLRGLLLMSLRRLTAAPRKHSLNRSAQGAQGARWRGPLKFDLHGASWPGGGQVPKALPFQQ
jgi:hypothetical protein